MVAIETNFDRPVSPYSWALINTPYSMLLAPANSRLDLRER